MTLRRFAAALAAFALAPAVAISHPLDGLTGAEMLRVTEILRAAGEANDQTRYPLIELLEPPKAEVLAWSDGDPEPRRALVHLLNQAGFRAAVVDITGGTVEAAGPATGSGRPGSLPTPAPTDPDVRVLPHPAPRRMASLRARGRVDGRHSRERVSREEAEEPLPRHRYSSATDG